MRRSRVVLGAASAVAVVVLGAGTAIAGSLPIPLPTGSPSSSTSDPSAAPAPVPQPSRLPAPLPSGSLPGLPPPPAPARPQPSSTSQWQQGSNEDANHYLHRVLGAGINPQISFAPHRVVVKFCLTSNCHQGQTMTVPTDSGGWVTYVFVTDTDR